MFGDPVERVQIAQAALSLFYVRLDHIARGAGAGVTLVALFQLGQDEAAMAGGDDILVEALLELGEQTFIAGYAARFQKRRLDRMVLFCQPHTFIDRARGVAHL